MSTVKWHCSSVRSCSPVVIYTICNDCWTKTHFSVHFVLFMYLIMSPPPLFWHDFSVFYFLFSPPPITLSLFREYFVNCDHCFLSFYVFLLLLLSFHRLTLLFPFLFSNTQVITNARYMNFLVSLPLDAGPSLLFNRIQVLVLSIDIYHGTTFLNYYSFYFFFFK